jgi:hypothetical protein
LKKGIYRHFKGGMYEVLGIAIHSETEEEMVIYRSLKNNSLWVRPKKMWEEKIEREGKIYQRFIYIGDNNEKNM